MKRVIIPIFGDAHAGSEFGLLNPKTELERERQDGTIYSYKPELTEIQKFLWETYTWAVDEVEHLAGKDDSYLFFMGDGTQGNKYAEELQSGALSDQIIIANDYFQPWMSSKIKIKATRLMKGTGSHSFGVGSSETLMSKILRGQYPKTNVSTYYHGLVLINNCLIDTSHHGPGAGSRVWLEGNTFRYYIRDLAMRDMLVGERPADVVVRAHVHTPLEECLRVQRHRIWGIVSPPLQFMNDYARKVTRSSGRVEMGVVALEIISSGKNLTIQPHWFTRILDIRTREVL